MLHFVTQTFRSIVIVAGSYGLFSGLRIHIHFMRIQHFRLNTDPDPYPIRIQGFNDQKLTKNYSRKKIQFFL
jgi:hypothetical protein